MKYWTAWNEPANPNWLQQVSGGRFVSPRSYARICTAIWQGVHFTNFAGEKVACGVTGPRGNNAPRSSRPSLSPLAFMRLTKAAGLRNLDAYAHNPYYGRAKRDARHAGPAEPRSTLGNMNTLIRLVNKLWGKKRIWITEYGWQTTAGPAVRRLVRATGGLRASVVRDRPCEPAHRHDGVVHAPRRHEPRHRVAVRLSDRCG